MNTVSPVKIVNKASLQGIFGAPFVPGDLIRAMGEIFGVTRMPNHPQPIQIETDDGSQSVQKYGDFTTIDHHRIGLYHVVLSDGAPARQDREVMRSLPGDDDAVVVFERGSKWGFAFVTGLKAPHWKGNPTWTEPQICFCLPDQGERSDFLLERLSRLAGRKASFADIRDAFSVEALHNAFYGALLRHFLRLVGGPAKAGLLRLPNVPVGNIDAHRDFALRLVGRTLFTWFLKARRSQQGIPVLPDALLSSHAVKSHAGYYHNVLERLFFQVFNRPTHKRPDNLPKGCESVPFLDTGLFDPGPGDWFEPDKTSGLSASADTLIVPDEWFFDFFRELEKYPFTLDEDSVVDVTLAIGPETPGMAFERLLAEMVLVNGKNGRRITGSFYTPRWVVDYMAVESLTHYLHNRTGIKPVRIRPVFNVLTQAPTFSPREKRALMTALERIRVLDPACGSGAFVLGVLDAIVTARQRLDPECGTCKERGQGRMSDADGARKEGPGAAGVEYVQKLEVIQNSLFGVDINPFAVWLTRMRVLLSLIRDAHIDDSRPNRGLEPLPRLGSHFVAANTLTGFQRNADRDRQNGVLFGGHKFDVIIGNPPYIMEYENRQAFDGVRHDPCYQGKTDIWHIFTCRALDLLGNDGILCFIAKNQWMNSDSASRMRKKIYEQADIRLVLDFGPNMIFENTGQQTMVFLLHKNNRTNARKTLYHRFDKMPIAHLKQAIMNNRFQFLEKVIPGDYDENRNLSFSQHDSLLDVIFQHRNFEFEAGEIIQGIIGGPDKAFIISGNELGQFSAEERRHIKNFHTHTDRYYTPESDKYIFYISKKTFGTDIADLPGMHARLSNYMRQLKGRREVRQGKTRWFDLWWPRDEGFFRAGEKVVWTARTRRGKFTYTTGPFYGSRNLFFLKTGRISLKYVTALCNSGLCDFYMKNRIKHNGNLLQLDKNQFLQLPVYNITHVKPFETLVDYIIFLKSMDTPLIPGVPNARLSREFEEVIDAMVMEVYFEQEFHNAGLKFMEYADRAFQAIPGRPGENMAIILEAYGKLRNGDCQIRVNLDSMDSRLPGIIGPIMRAEQVMRQD